MQAAYGIDLRSALWGPERLGVRRLGALVDGLPPGGALDRAVDPDGWGSGWGNTEELLAKIAELVHLNWAQFVVTHSKKGAQPPRPLRIPRPHDRRRVIRKPTGKQLRAFLESKGVIGRRAG